MTNLNRIAFPSSSFDSELATAGFSRRRNGSGYTRNGFTFMAEENWPVLRSKARPVSTDPLIDRMGTCGLWKCLTVEERVIRMFEFPPWMITGRESGTILDEAGEITPFETMLAWAFDTFDGDSPPGGWSLPPRDEVDAMIPGYGLTVQNGSLVRQGEVVREENRLALRFVILPELPEDLPDHRLRWLRRLLIDAQNRWRLVRVGFADGENDTAVHAEVDLTGAPGSLLADLISTALPALRFVVEWVSASAVFLVEGSADCRALELEAIHSAKNHSKRKGGEKDG